MARPTPKHPPSVSVQNAIKPGDDGFFPVAAVHCCVMVFLPELAVGGQLPSERRAIVSNRSHKKPVLNCNYSFKHYHRFDEL